MSNLCCRIFHFWFSIFYLITCQQALKSSSEAADMQIWIDKVKLWLKERYSLERTQFMVESRSKNQLNSEQIGDGKLPIWLAAQRAVARYEGFLSSVGPRGRLIRKLLTWMEIIPSMPEASLDLKKETSYSEAYLRLVLHSIV